MFFSKLNFGHRQFWFSALVSRVATRPSNAEFHCSLRGNNNHKNSKGSSTDAFFCYPKTWVARCIPELEANLPMSKKFLLFFSSFATPYQRSRHVSVEYSVTEFVNAKSRCRAAAKKCKSSFRELQLWFWREWNLGIFEAERQSGGYSIFEARQPAALTRRKSFRKVSRLVSKIWRIVSFKVIHLVVVTMKKASTEHAVTAKTIEIWWPITFQIKSKLWIK